MIGKGAVACKPTGGMSIGLIWNCSISVRSVAVEFPLPKYVDCLCSGASCSTKQQWKPVMLKNTIRIQIIRGMSSVKTLLPKLRFLDQVEKWSQHYSLMKIWYVWQVTWSYSWSSYPGWIWVGGMWQTLEYANWNLHWRESRRFSHRLHRGQFPQCWWFQVEMVDALRLHSSLLIPKWSFPLHKTTTDSLRQDWGRTPPVSDVLSMQFEGNLQYKTPI